MGINRVHSSIARRGVIGACGLLCAVGISAVVASATAAATDNAQMRTDRIDALGSSPEASQYRAAVATTVTCLKQAGLNVEGPYQRDEFGTLAFQYWSAGELTDEQARTAGNRCQDSHQKQAEWAWSQAVLETQRALGEAGIQEPGTRVEIPVVTP